MDTLQEDICAICRDTLAHPRIVSLECQHKFHTNCIKGWYIRDHKTCPVCRDPYQLEESACFHCQRYFYANRLNMVLISIAVIAVGSLTFAIFLLAYTLLK
jgi:hypothetical protein